MEWGDVPGWAALAIAAGAFWVSWKARRDGTRNADAAERSATAAEHALADQRREAAERRAAELEAARPKAELRIEYAGRRNYALRNRGDAAAINVINTEPHGAVDEWPVPLSLRPGEAHRFMIVGDNGVGLPPTHLSVQWDGADEPVVLPVP
ncbi:hypothetical protein ACFVP3_23550 [Streptomyces sp. NPDC057806]|uniref:hypothetical protein n=1 Tax=Streptomyces sp. NPDC057806 TaxID=3346255 RepID=UPI0036AC5BD1